MVSCKRSFGIMQIWVSSAFGFLHFRSVVTQSVTKFSPDFASCGLFPNQSLDCSRPRAFTSINSLKRVLCRIKCPVNSKPNVELAWKQQFSICDFQTFASFSLNKQYQFAPILRSYSLKRVKKVYIFSLRSQFKEKSWQLLKNFSIL